MLEIEAPLGAPDAGISEGVEAPVKEAGMVETLEPPCSPVIVALDSGTRTTVDSMVTGLIEPV